MSRALTALGSALAVIGIVAWWQYAVRDATQRATTADPAPMERRTVELGHLAEADVPVRIRVVHADGRPAVYAEVFLEDPGCPSAVVESFDRNHPLHSLAARLEQLGARHVTDENGEVQLPLPRIGLIGVAAHSGRYWGSEVLRRENFGPDATITVTLAAAADLSVLVTDAHGQPRSDVPVGFRSDAYRETRALTLTRADGIARMRAMELSTLDRPSNPAFPAVTFGFPCGDDGVRTIQTAEFDGEPVRLQLPPLGSVTAAIRSIDGAPVRDGITVILQAREEEVTAFFAWRPSASLRSARTKTCNGEAHFPHVGLGLDLELAADFQDAGRFEVLRFSGPREIGDRVLVLLEQKIMLPEIRGQLVSVSGVPFQGGPLLGQLITVSPFGSVQSRELLVSADGDGAFRVAIDAFAAFDEAQRLRIRLAFVRPGLTLVALAEREVSTGSNTVDFGRMILGGDLLVAGHAVSPQAGPVRNAYGRLDFEEGVASRAASISAMKVPWSTGMDARFEVRGAFPPGRYSITGTAEGMPPTWENATADFQSGDTNCLLQFWSQYVVSGRMMHDDHIPFERFRFRLRENNRVLEGALADYSDSMGWFRIPLYGERSLVDFEIFGGDEAWPLLSFMNHERDRDSQLYLGRLDLRGELGIAKFAPWTARGRSVRTVLLFPEASRQREAFTELRAGQSFVFRLDAPHCVASIPGAPLLDVELRSGQITLQD